MTDAFGPNERPDAIPPHANVIRRFREELRMDRLKFSKLLDVNVDTLRVWETNGKSRPRAAAAMIIVEYAERNDYPLELIDIFPPKKKKKTRKKK